MKTFDPLAFDPARCRQEALQLQDQLTRASRLRERDDILPFFRARPHLSAACGLFNPTGLLFDRIAWEYDLFGDFGCDLVVGDSHSRGYTFIEFENAAPASVFVRHGRKATREWAPRFLGGFAQVVDWFRKLDDMQKGDAFEARFGRRVIDFAGVLVIGRDRDLGPDERLRFTWWRENVLVRSRRVSCLTYDELAASLIRYLDASARRPAGKAPRGKGRGGQTTG
jgi:hypothetical protein